MKDHRYIGAFKDIVRPCHNLYEILFSDIHLGHQKVIRVGMLFNVYNLCYDNFFIAFAEMLHRFNVGAGHDHSVTELFSVRIHIRIFLQPFDWY